MRRSSDIMDRTVFGSIRVIGQTFEIPEGEFTDLWSLKVPMNVEIVNMMVIPLRRRTPRTMRFFVEWYYKI